MSLTVNEVIKLCLSASYGLYKDETTHSIRRRRGRAITVGLTHASPSAEDGQQHIDLALMQSTTHKGTYVGEGDNFSIQGEWAGGGSLYITDVCPLRSFWQIMESQQRHRYM